MLLHLNVQGKNATDLGYLLGKHPDKHQTKSLSFGQAHIFYPEATAQSCSACLLLDIDTTKEMRQQRRDNFGRNANVKAGFDQYVNDRAYVASSLLCSAIAKVYGSALNGNCNTQPALVEKQWPIHATIGAVCVRGEVNLLNRLFEPLGYTVEYETTVLDSEHPEWGQSPYYLLSLKGHQKIQSLLQHLYILLPILDNRKHYYYREAEIEQVLDANDATFSVLHLIVEKRLERGLLTVVDATNLDENGRKGLVDLAYKYYLKPQAIVLNPSLDILLERNTTRSNRNIATRVIARQYRRVQQSLRHLRKEGFQSTQLLKGERVAIQLQPMPSDYKHETGGFDIIGDIHGCFIELVELLEKLDYKVQSSTSEDFYGFRVVAPKDRRAVFVGDLVDRGPASNQVLRLVMSMVENGQAFCVPGNHDDKLRRYLKGNKVKIAHGLAETIEQLETEPEAFRQMVADFFRGLTYHLELDQGKLLVAHAGLQENMHGRVGGAVRSFCLYGQTTGETDDQGLPVRYPWAQDYQGQPLVVYGHTPTENPQWFNRTICLDTGCVFGGQLTALRYPEKELVKVQAKKTYAESARPMIQGSPAQKTVLQAADVLGRQTLETRLYPNVLIQEGQASQALETMSRFAADPRQLIYLPPTMSPVKTSKLPDFLEHPAEAFSYYRELGITSVVCQEKHMGSRAVIVVAKTAKALEERFGLNKGLGWILTRTGRPFFSKQAVEQGLLQRISAQLTRSNFWERHQTDWVLLDSELMPWSAKAEKLLEQQYAATASAGDIALAEVSKLVEKVKKRGVELNGLSEQIKRRGEHIERFREAYRRYCWTVEDVTDLKIAPFHLLATEGAVHTTQDHHWHLQELATFCGQEEPCLMMTNYRWVQLDNDEEVKAATDWWLQLTEAGGEGMVVKPWEFVSQIEGRLVQPALKVRGREYLRIIYGPDYTLPENMDRLRSRRVGRKRSLAEREFALGIEAMERFVRRESLSKVHQCVFGILALESEVVDPTL